jgi:excisionase family DNA binding protein
MPLMLTREQAADLLVIGVQVISRSIRRGDLRAVRFADSGASRVMIPRGELLRWIDSRQVNVSAVRHGRKPVA